jgi:simple sugar transport system permease protein/ribose transport system permease protein
LAEGRAFGFRQAARTAGFGAVVGAVAMLLAFTIIDFSGWWTVQTIRNVLHFTAILGFVAMGQALVIMSKEIDLSVGSVYGLGGVSFIMLQEPLGIPGAMLAGLFFCALIGLAQAMAVVKGGLPSMIVTLGGLFFVRGVIYVWTGGSVRSLPVEARNHWLTRLLGGELFGVEAALFWMLLVLAILSVMLWQMRFGNRLLAAGGDINTARTQGVDTVRIKTLAFVFCSILAGAAGIITLADKPQTHVTLGEFMELEAIASAVIGGCLLSGGRGSLLGAVLGAFIVTSVRYELIALGAPSSWFITFIGIVLIVAVIFNQQLARWAFHRA